MTNHDRLQHLEQSGWQPFFQAHNQKELTLAAEIWPHLPRACAANVRHYFELAREAAFGVCNRLHASMALAGLGIPSVTVGTDSRLFMVRMTGQPAFYVKEATAEQMIAAVDHLRDHRDAESKRLLALHDTTLKEHLELLQPFFELGVD
jgi:hypothetical protein